MAQSPPVSFAAANLRPWWFLAGWVAVALAFWKPLHATTILAIDNEWYTQALLAPGVSLGLMWLESSQVFAECRIERRFGIALSIAAAILIWIGWSWQPSATADQGLWIPMLAMVAVWAGVFLYFNGSKASRAALFPLAFLLLTVPVPAHWMEAAVRGLQQSSADTTYGLFQLLRIPVERQGLFRFDLPGLKIEVAEECSGVHSAIALLIAAMLAGHLLLRTTWKQALFVLIAIPLAILKNGIRIVSICTLTIYVDPRIIDGPLHHQGGPVFAVVGLALLAPVLFFLWKSETRAGNTPSS